MSIEVLVILTYANIQYGVINSIHAENFTNARLYVSIGKSQQFSISIFVISALFIFNSNDTN